MVKHLFLFFAPGKMLGRLADGVVGHRRTEEAQSVFK